MKYFLAEADDRNHIPYGINKNREFDIRKIHNSLFYKIPSTNIVEFDVKSEMIFPDILSNPLFLLSKFCLEVLEFYELDLTYKLVYLLNKEQKINHAYYMPELFEVDCFPQKASLIIMKVR